jgi:hypothetical protein
MAQSEEQIRPLRVLPGGAQAIPEEYFAAGVLVVALGALWVIRRNLGNEASHVHVGGTAAIVGLLFFLIYTAVTRIAISFAAANGDRDTTATRGFAFFA